MLIGFALVAYPYLMDSNLYLSLVGTALTAALFIFRG